MRFKIILLILCSFSYTFCYSQESTIEIPLNSENGFGSFVPDMHGARFYLEDDNNKWKKTYLNVTGIPTNWKNVKKGDFETNKYQSLYQNYFSGKITQKWYEYVQKGWGWLPDTLGLSKNPIVSKIAFASGIDENGEMKIIIDANNNLNFSDDSIFTPLNFNVIAHTPIDTLAQKHSIIVTYERLLKNEVIQDKIPLLVLFSTELNRFLYNFPTYSTATFQEIEIAVCSDKFCSPSFIESTIILLIDSVGKDKKADEKSLTSSTEFISINNSLYLNKGVNFNKNVLVLEKVNTNQNQIESTKVGFKAISFKGEDFKTKKIIKTADYKGKYLLIDFWGTWCKPCIQELPNLKEIYDNTDRTKFEIIGIAVNSTSEALNKMMDKNSITWPQIVSDSKNRINDIYGISNYPTTFIVDPTGTIIEKNLKGNELKNKIYELTIQ